MLGSDGRIPPAPPRVRTDRSLLLLSSTLSMLALATSCTNPRESPAEPSPATTATLPAPPSPTAEPLLVEVTAAAGIEFSHWNGMSGERYIVEMMGAGAAMLDYDGDGDMDIYLRQGAVLGRAELTARAPAPPPARLCDRLFRNDGVGAGGSVPHFTDVTEESGIHATGYAMGLATGDYDNDGDVDLYLTNFGPNVMLRNEGNGTFAEVTQATGTGDDRWSVPASFVDYDRDGWLDLFVGNYIDFSLGNHKPCRGPDSAIDYCGPTAYEPEPDRLFRNRGDGTFEDATGSAGLTEGYGNALGSLAADLDMDGWPDIYVANDATENNLWLNQHDGRFVDDGLLRGFALNGAGQREGSMGIDAGDVDGDGDEDLFVTNLVTETNTLYINQGDGTFVDGTVVARLASVSLPLTGFGTGLFDADGDGQLDLVVVNGAVRIDRAQEQLGSLLPLAEPNQLFLSAGDGSFVEASERASESFRRPDVGRAAAFGDVDDDGRVDILTTSNDGPAHLLLGAGTRGGHWCGLRLLARAGSRDALGARVTLGLTDGGAVVRRVRADGSYLAASDPRVSVWLAAPRELERIDVAWPSGVHERFAPTPFDTYTALHEGQGAEIIP